MSTADEVKALRIALDEFRAEQRMTNRERLNRRPRDPEQLDPTPMEGAVQGPPGPPPMAEQIQAYIREVVSKQAAEDDLGTFEEEDDFEPDEDEELLSLSGFEITEATFIPEEPAQDPEEPITAPEAPEAPEAPSSESEPPPRTAE